MSEGVLCLECLLLGRPVARGGSVGSDEPPSQIKGPLFCTKRSTFYNKRSTFNNKGPLFKTEGPLFSPICKQKVHYKESKSPLSEKVHQHFF